MGDGAAFDSLLREFKSNSTPAQQALEKTISAVVNDTWEDYKKNGAKTITDQFISVENWKIGFGTGIGPLRRKAALKIGLDVDLEREGFLEQDPKNGQLTYDSAVQTLLEDVRQAFSSDGEEFIGRFLDEVDGLMTVSNKNGPPTAVSDLMEEMLKPAEEGGNGVCVKDGTKCSEDAENRDGKKKCKIYLTSVKCMEELATLKSKLTQLKFEDDFDHPCLNQALPKDSLEVWMTGPARYQLKSFFRVALARLTTEKDAAKGKLGWR